jgi:hypothetical protein
MKDETKKHKGLISSFILPSSSLLRSRPADETYLVRTEEEGYCVQYSYPVNF